MEKSTEKLLEKVFSKLIYSTEDKPTHFKIVRLAKSWGIKLIPEQYISDYHLDTHQIYFYKNDKELTLKLSWGIDTKGFKTDVLYPIHELLNAK